MTIVLPGPTAWTAATWVVRGFLTDARPHLAAAPTLAPRIERACEIELYGLDLAAATGEQLEQLRALIRLVRADHPVAADAASEAIYVAKLDELDRLAAAAAPAPTGDAPHTVAGGRIVVGATIDAGADTGLYRGHVVDAPAARRLITISGPHAASYDQLRAELALPINGVAPLEFIGRTDGGWGGDCMVEVEPDGAPALAAAPLPESSAIRIGIEVAAIAARAHAAGLVLGGIRPDLIYVERGAVTGVVPRAPRFIMSARPASSGGSALAAFYDPEAVRALPAVAGSDVFALCASVFQLVTGQHPFGVHAGEQLSRLVTPRPLDWPGSAELGAILRSGFSAATRDRSTAAELGAALASLITDRS